MPATQPVFHTLSDGEKLYVRPLGMLWVVMSDRSGALAKSYYEQQAVDTIKLAMLADKQSAAWDNSVIQKQSRLKDHLVLTISKEIGARARIQLVDPNQQGQNKTISNMYDVDICRWRDAIAVGEIYISGELAFRDPAYATILAAEVERLLEVKLAAKPNSRNLPRWIANFWRARASTGASPDTPGIMTRYRKTQEQLNALIQLQDFVNPSAMAAIGKSLGWPMKSIVDKAGDTVDCWLESPNGSQFDGIEFAPAGTYEAEAPNGCRIVEVDTDSLTASSEDSKVENAVHRLLGDEIAEHLAASAVAP